MSRPVAVRILYRIGIESPLAEQAEIVGDLSTRENAGRGEMRQAVLRKIGIGIPTSRSLAVDIDG